MKKYYNIIVLVLAVIGVILIQHEYFPTINTIVEYDTTYLDTVKVKKIPKPYPVYIDTGHIDTIRIPMDSAELVEAYMKLNKAYSSTYTYNDTLINDSILYFNLETEITKNKPILYTPTYYIKNPFIHSTVTTIEYDKSLWLNVNASYKILTPSLMYQTGKYQYGIGYNILNNNVMFTFGIRLLKR